MVTLKHRLWSLADEKDAQIALLEARLESSELANVRLGLEWEHSYNMWTESLERGERISKMARQLSDVVARLEENS